MSTAFWYNLLTIVFSNCLIAYGSGSLVLYKGIKVNYTRKINHFMLFFLPVFLDVVFPYEKSIGGLVINCIIAVLSLLIYVKPLRTRISFISTMFLSIDRPEDRPHTLLWLSTQMIAGFLIIIPAVMLFNFQGYENLVFIPILINAIGDGLAEPVGVRFGRLKYKTHALFSEKKYVRTIEGSLCVLITSIVVIVLFKTYFSPAEFIAALITVPLAMTLAEAFAPHTWDTPFLFFIGYLSLYVIKSISL